MESITHVNEEQQTGLTAENTDNCVEMESAAA